MPTYGPGEVPLWSREANYDNRYSGTLYLTNRRLFFERKVGIIRKKKTLPAETELKDVTSASIEKGPWNWNVLVIATRDQRHKFLLREENPDVLMRQINELIASHSAVPEGPTP